MLSKQGLASMLGNPGAEGDLQRILRIPAVRSHRLGAACVTGGGGWVQIL